MRIITFNFSHIKQNLLWVSGRISKTTSGGGFSEHVFYQPPSRVESEKSWPLKENTVNIEGLHVGLKKKERYHKPVIRRGRAPCYKYKETDVFREVSCGSVVRLTAFRELDQRAWARTRAAGRPVASWKGMDQEVVVWNEGMGGSK